MDLDAQLGQLSESKRHTSGPSFLERRLSRLITSRQPRHTEDVRGPLGLTLLRESPETQVNIVFVHGLRGGSRKTWSFTDAASHFWPKEWLPIDPGFQNASIFSYGYDSDWSARKDSVINVYDFAKGLLNDVFNSPELRKDNTSAILLVGHSMGGLVMKRAYLLAKRDPTYHQLAGRIRAMVFLGTAHRGASSAQLLSKLLSVAGGDKGYVQDLIPNSGLLQAINDEFRHEYQDLQICSFYERVKTALGYTKDIIVPEDSAVMGLPGERTQPLDADHRHICKFSGTTDPSYISVRNALLTIFESLKRQRSVSSRNNDQLELQSVLRFIGGPRSQEDELRYINDLQVEGSCSWLVAKQTFQMWHSGNSETGVSTAPKIFWLQGNPGMGKSVITGHIIRFLVDCDAKYSYFFFKHNDISRSTISALLRSLACQMASADPLIRGDLAGLVEDGNESNIDDERTVWRRLFLSCMFRRGMSRPHYWIIDGLDECSNYQALFPLLSKLDPQVPLRIFITSRPLPSTDRLLREAKINIATETVGPKDTTEDIRLFLRERGEFVTVENEDERHTIIERITSKSNGSFLWASTIAKELATTYTKQQVEDVLSQVPSQMDDVYNRVLTGIQSVPRNQVLAKAIFRWTVCAARPLLVSELKEALSLDINLTVPQLGTVLGSITGCLVHVGLDDKVQLVHETVRSFLVSPAANPDYAVDEHKDNLRVAEVCLTYLCVEEPRSTRMSTAAKPKRSAKSDLAGYAVRYFSHHLARASQTTHDSLILLDRFLRTNILGWIESVARAGDMSVLLETSRNLLAHLQLQTQAPDSLAEERGRIATWSNDLDRIVAAFGRNLISLPESAHLLMPAICPLNSMVKQDSMAASGMLEVVGSLDHEWDDRVSSIVYADAKPRCIASCTVCLAVGLSDGKIQLYKAGTFEDIYTLEHGEPVRQLCFGHDSDLLASSGRKKLVLWSSQSGVQVWSTDVSDFTLGMWFGGDNETLILATRNNKVVSFNTDTGRPLTSSGFFDLKEDNCTIPVYRQEATHAAFCPTMNLLAVGYTNRPISTWDMEDNSFLGHSHKGEPGIHPAPLLLGLTVNPDPRLELAAASYDDGDLVVFNPFDGQMRAVKEAYAHVLASSPDGKILATGDGDGVIQLFDFESLRLLYRVALSEYDVRSITFGPNSQRFFDIRNSQFNVWDPNIQWRESHSGDEAIQPYHDKLRLSAAHIPSNTLSDVRRVTVLCDHPSGKWIFAGREDGSVAVIDVSTGTELQQIIGQGAMPVNHLIYNKNNNRLAISNVAGRISVRSVHVLAGGGWVAEEPTWNLTATRPVKQLLFNDTGHKLLITTKEISELWDIEKDTQFGSAIRPQNPEQSTWQSIKHPESDEQLLLIDGEHVHIYDWKTFSQISSPDGIGLSGIAGSPAAIDCAIASCSGRYLCFRFVNRSDKTFPDLQVYPVGGMSLTAVSLTPISRYRNLARRIKTVIGIYRSSLLFLSVDGWICSLRVDHDAVQDHYSRHFFIPFSWYNVGDMSFAVTANGSIAMSRRNGVVIFHHAVDYFNETVGMDLAKTEA
ncbi:hypothetical protein CONLIGDRAFT_707468 [Coniochaeta ligniaria NRRL 30616]|uniref:GPI inositol-deacylase n=1 Tax=Coniochaeta ligniaria NRRL 30616 TaxID=1408157 RepID=A0A1J7IGQ3_9PEZI|nr:hypothetical protein CONLIGDRAFT_707468 [Coniochaeta ligniaria NRRL 30616]